jgi:hypothetical protein
MENQKKLLAEVLTNYAVPDPKIVGKLPKGGIQLDFVGHADITRILIEIDPLWSYEPCGWDNGRPAIHVENGMATMWAYLIVHGKKMLGVGSVRADKQELDKELVGDFLRNAAMRFGISLALWTKNEWEDLGGHAPAPQKSTPARKPAPKPVADIAVTSTIPVDPEIVGKFIKACAGANLDHDKVADTAGVDLSNVTNDDMNKLRVVFKEMSQNK